MTSEYNDEKLAEAVKTMEDLVDEAVQIYELDKEKANVLDDMYNSLKIITAFLSFSMDVHPQFLGLSEDTRIILTPSLDLQIITSNYKFENKRLDELTLDQISNILRYVVPLIANAAKNERLSKNKKIALLRESTKKLKRLPTSNQDNVIVNDSVRLGKVEST
ncbi:MAG TPA: hypothetical protein VIG05_00055 [Candidatus Nitrosotenuis sp.]|jgi:hypothetical protein